MPSPVAPADVVLARSADGLQGMACALEPPRTPVRQRRCDAAAAAAPSEGAITSVMADVTRLLSSGITPAQHAQAHGLLAWSEGLIAQHYRPFWLRGGPGGRAVEHVQAAVRDDPQSASATSNYAMTLLGIRASFFRGLAERALNLDSTAELTRVTRRLTIFPGDLKAQTLLGMAVDSLRGDSALPPDLLRADAGLTERIARLRAQNPRGAEEVDDALLDMQQRVAAQR